MPLESGLKVGEHVPSFYTRAVTGPLMNKSVCYVCRNGQRPVVMVLMRRIDAELKPLMKSLDRLVDGNRAAGLGRDGIARRMSAAEIAEAERLAAAWRPAE